MKPCYNLCMKKIIKITLITLTLILLIIALAGMYKFNYLASKDGYGVDGSRISVTDFDSCERAGGMILESYPRQCAWTDMVFINKEEQRLLNDELKRYEGELTEEEVIYSNKDLPGIVGLTIKEAQKLASENNRLLRVVEEDGEMYMVTMDYSPGRINVSVIDGKVVSYTVE